MLSRSGLMLAIHVYSRRLGIAALDSFLVLPELVEGVVLLEICYSSVLIIFFQGLVEQD